MIFTKLEMTRFGKFRDHVTELSPGLTARQQDNESGKTTTADFILFMFYGLTYRGRKSMVLSEDLLEKYQPWDSEEGLSGAIEFVDHDGKSWRLERTQNKKGKGEVRVFDAEGRLCQVNNVGQTFLGIDAETFANVFFVRESGQTFRRTEQMEIAMKNLVTTGSESVGYDSVMAFLNEEKAKYVSPKGGAGKLKRLENIIQQLRAQIALEQTRLEQERTALTAETAIQQQLEQCDAELEMLAAHEQQTKAYERFVKSQKRGQLAAQAQQLTETIEGAAPPLTQTEISALREGFTETEGAGYLLEQAQRDLTALQTQAPVFTEQDQQILEHERAAHVGGGAVALTAAAGVLGVIALFAAILWNPLCWIAVGTALAAVIILLLFALRLPKGVTLLGIRNRARLRHEIARAKEALERSLRFRREQVAAAKAVEDRKEHIKVLERKYGPLREQTGIYDRATLDAVLQSNSKTDVLRQRLQDIYARMDELGDVEHVPEVTPPERSAEEIARRQQEIRLQKDRLQALQMAQTKQQVELENGEAALAALKDELEEKTRLAEQMRQAYEVVTLAIEQMNVAQAKLRENYAPKLRQAMSAKLSMLTDGKYDAVMLDENLSIRIKAEGGMRELGYFSAGTKDAAMLALRLSLAEILEGAQKLPMIFDDPFLHLDTRRFAVLMEYLQKAGKERQILLLSCREL